jgi:5'-phosphate synthase pdxT subunit
MVSEARGAAGSGGLAALGPPLVGVLAVQGAFAEHEHAIEVAGGRARAVRVPAELEGIDALVVPGGESTTFGLVASRSGLLDAVRERIADGLPVLGTCAGMIMLADATTGGPQPLLGGMDVVVRRNAFGRQVASFETELAMPALGSEPIPAVFIRAPWIESAGPDVEVLAEHAGHPVAVRQGSLLAVAFHPELTGDTRLHRLLLDMAREARVTSRQRGTGGERVRAQ